MTTNSSSLKESIQTILSSQYLAVLATNTGTAPYTSLIGFMASTDLKQIYFATLTSTRKYNNITKHSQVSLLIDSRTNRGGEDFKNSSALTILGNAETVPQVQQAEILSLYLDKFCHLQDFTSDPQCALVRINVEKYILVQRFQEVFELTIKQPNPTE
jgi:general stress protein 26